MEILSEEKGRSMNHAKKRGLLILMILCLVVSLSPHAGIGGQRIGFLASPFQRKARGDGERQGNN